MSNEKQYPAPDELKSELEQYLSGPDAEADAQKLADAQTAKAQLEKLGLDVPPQLQEQIDGLEAKNPLNKVPKWATKNEWIKVLESRKDKLQKAIDDLDDIKPAMRRELEAEIQRIDKKLTVPDKDFGGLSRAEYAKSIRKVVGLKDETETPERTLSPEQTEKLLSTLKARFEVNMKRHKGIEWSKVEARLNEASPEKLWSLNEMERTGGEPDVAGYVEETGEYEFWDFSKESPKGRRNVCYDREGQEAAERRGKSPAGNAIDMAAAMGLGGLLDRDQYENKLQELGEFDRNSWSWIKTPDDKRKQGVALNAVRHGAVVHVYEGVPDDRNVDRAFRGWLRV